MARVQLIQALNKGNPPALPRRGFAAEAGGTGFIVLTDQG